MANLDDDDTYVFEPAIIKLTPFDRRSQELRVLQDKRDELATHPDSQRRLAQLDYQIKKARELFEEEQRRGTDDDWRRLRNIDDWRSSAGKEMRNTSRRKVRSKPNEDLSHLTPEQKEERKRFQRADANYRKRQQQKGIPEAEIQAEILVRQQQRDAEHKTNEETETLLAENPTYGMF